MSPPLWTARKYIHTTLRIHHLMELMKVDECEQVPNLSVPSTVEMYRMVDKSGSKGQIKDSNQELTHHFKNFFYSNDNLFFLGFPSKRAAIAYLEINTLDRSHCISSTPLFLYILLNCQCLIPARYRGSLSTFSQPVLSSSYIVY